MARVSRVGRKEQITKIVYQDFKRGNSGGIQCHKIARKLGLVSSTNIKNMCKEIALENDNIMLGHIDGVLSLKWSPYQQIHLPERYITINGKGMKVASWVFDSREYSN